jgi:beta-glucosidase
MTLEEKIGQLNQDNFDQPNLQAAIAAGKVGSVISESDPENIQRLQHIAVEKSRLHIPILFGHDVIHGYRTIFPIPLGLASSWDTALIERMARISASEASAAGVRWTFSPMVDIARDPRWGRIAEGSGEDTYLQSELAAAYVRGYQGKNLADADSVAACVKHYVGYGAAEAGRDYNSVDMSTRKLREVYLPPFRAAIDAGAPTVMSAFNTLNGVPATADPFILRQILRREWGFRGLVVSDYNAIPELVPHGVAANKEEAGMAAFTAGVDMDMCGQVYLDQLARLVREGKVPEALIDDAVRRVLRLKFELGLFDHPYTDLGALPSLLLTTANRNAARQIASQSMVLLKNEGDILPLDPSQKIIAVIGPLADSQSDMLGSWFATGDSKDVVTVLAGIRSRTGNPSNVLYSSGGQVESSTPNDIATAVETARKADVVLMVLGEKGTMSGEAASRADLDLPGDQQKLLEEVVATGKPVVLVVMSGRPLVLSWAAEHVAAILEAWFPGTEAGNAVADLVFGTVNPSGKLPVTFPRSVGQIPIYYNELNTGRPLVSEMDKKYKSAYIDSPNSPLYPFGFGLSYTRFQYSQLKVQGPDDHGDFHITVDVKNVGDRSGDEVVQVYSRDLVARVARPVKELKAFRRVTLAPGEVKTVEFKIARNDLGFWDENDRYVIAPGKFTLTVGPDSRTAAQQAMFVVPPRAGSALARRNGTANKKSFSGVRKTNTISGERGASATQNAF